MALPLNAFEVDDFLRAALREDAPLGDRTSEVLGLSGRARGSFTARQGGILCGLFLAQRTFELLDPSASFDSRAEDGDLLAPGAAFARVEGSLPALLFGERLALNLLQRLSGIATLTRACVEEVAGTGARILDTRKTTPGLRALEKYAVRTGGGKNHRMGLSDGILIKDNHLAGFSSLGEAVRRARERAGHLLKVEVEVRNLSEFQEAVEAGADLILLDNMPLSEMAEAVRRRPPGLLLEASGGMRPGRLRAAAETGVDFISVGALTHSAPALDLALEIEPLP